MFENFRMIFGKIVDMDAVIAEANVISGDRPAVDLVMALTVKAIAEKQQAQVDELMARLTPKTLSTEELEKLVQVNTTNVVDLNSVRNLKEANANLGEIVEHMGESFVLKTPEQYEQERQMIGQLNKNITINNAPEGLDSYDIYLTKGGEIIGFHAVGYAGQYNYTVSNLDKSIETKSSDFQVLESWGNQYDEDHNMLGRGSFRIHSHDLEETAKEYEAEGWTRRAKPGKVKP